MDGFCRSGRMVQLYSHSHYSLPLNTIYYYERIYIMATILGLNFGHDGAAALVKDGRLIGAITQERLTRVKKATGVTVQMVDYVLDMVNAKIADIDMVAFSGYEYDPTNEVKVFENNGKEVTQNLYDLDFYKGGEACQVSIGGIMKKALYVHHHLD